MQSKDKMRKVQGKYREKVRKRNEAEEYKNEIFFIFILIILIFIINSGSLFLDRDVKIWIRAPGEIKPSVDELLLGKE
ncbi:hypothetical protein [Cytobacillus oceanisediminis]|uniref:Uncharacterized protein n=1 Tax=Cytobacillus oceanisediminis 2691 TaxID=1196031 RepID=A0A160MEX7_9BACI|nr:hypothetical protein [Cytobacillus oceanisediminis]AND41463.1 hypothetical protein A361_20620 [Cytobacillus oceanisediminis 2691]